MPAFKLSVFTCLFLAATAFAGGGEPEGAALAFNSLEFAHQLDAAEFDLTAFGNRLRDAEIKVAAAKKAGSPGLPAAEAELARARAAFADRFGKGAESLRDKMWEARNRAHDIRRHGVGTAAALQVAERDYEKFARGFLGRWKGKSALPGRVGRVGVLGLSAAAVAAPVAMEAYLGSRAEAEELPEEELRSVEASAELGDP